MTSDVTKVDADVETEGETLSFSNPMSSLSQQLKQNENFGEQSI